MGDCESCASWRKDGWLSETQGVPWGTCSAIGDDPGMAARWEPTSERASTGPFAGADGATFDTRGDFGCVEWAPLAAPSSRDGAET